MSQLSKKARVVLHGKGIHRGANYSQLVAAEQSQFSVAHGFTKQQSELGMELSAAANKLNSLRTGRRLKKMEDFLKTKIETIISDLERLNCTVIDIDNGQYRVVPRQFGVIMAVDEASDSSDEERVGLGFN